MEPETSSRNTKFEAGRLSTLMRRAWRPIRTSWCCGFQGAGRQLTVLHDEAPHVAVGGAVDVDRECRQGIRGDGDKRVLDDLVVLLTIDGRLVPPCVGRIEPDAGNGLRVFISARISSQCDNGVRADALALHPGCGPVSHYQLLQLDHTHHQAEIDRHGRVRLHTYAGLLLSFEADEPGDHTVLSNGDVRDRVRTVLLCSRRKRSSYDDHMGICNWRPADRVSHMTGDRSGLDDRQGS